MNEETYTWSYVVFLGSMTHFVYQHDKCGPMDLYLRDIESMHVRSEYDDIFSSASVER